MLNWSTNVGVVFIKKTRPVFLFMQIFKLYFFGIPIFCVFNAYSLF
ncbi:hypothetical protein P20495_2238 [Pseudoalteromonas sp. BSi20495]|nr:hypothetical protein P20495_2238 [Pseudoalteromonas sp. BSi20495]